MAKRVGLRTMQSIGGKVLHSRATWADMIRNEACYLSKTGTFTNLVAHLAFRVTAIDVNASASYNHFAVLWSIQNALGAPFFVDANRYASVSVSELGTKKTTFVLYVDQGEPGFNWTLFPSTTLDVGTTYYLTIERSGADLTCHIYSDPARTTLIDTISCTLPENADVSMPYIQVTTSLNNSDDGNDQSDGWVESFEEDFTAWAEVDPNNKLSQTKL